MFVGRRSRTSSPPATASCSSLFLTYFHTRSRIVSSLPRCFSICNVETETSATPTHSTRATTNKYRSRLTIVARAKYTSPSISNSKNKAKEYQYKLSNKKSKYFFWCFDYFFLLNKN